MEITESIYEGVVEPSYQKPTREHANCADHNRKKRGESASSHTHYGMRENAGKQKKRYVDRPLGESKTCLIHIPVHSYDECKVLVDVAAKFVVGKPTKDRRIHTVPINKSNSNQENFHF